MGSRRMTTDTTTTAAALEPFLSAPIDRVFFTAAEVREALRTKAGYPYSKHCVGDAVRAGRLGFVRFGERYSLFPTDDVLRLLDPAHKRTGEDTIREAFANRSTLRGRELLDMLRTKGRQTLRTLHRKLRIWTAGSTYCADAERVRQVLLEHYHPPTNHLRS